VLPQDGNPRERRGRARNGPGWGLGAGGTTPGMGWEGKGSLCKHTDSKSARESWLWF